MNGPGQSLMIYGWQILDRYLLEFFFFSESAPKEGSEVLSNSDSTSEKIFWTNFEISNFKFQKFQNSNIIQNFKKKTLKLFFDVDYEYDSVSNRNSSIERERKVVGRFGRRLRM